MMKILLSDVERLVKEEYDRASEQHGERFHSPHEAYAVILEELQEAAHEYENVRDFLKEFWYQTKKDSFLSCEFLAKDIQDFALRAAAEMIQLAAMAHKAQKGYKNEPVD